MSHTPEYRQIRIELYPRSKDLDVTAKRLKEDFLREHPDVAHDSFDVKTAKAYLVSGSTEVDLLSEYLKEILVNPLLDETTPPESWDLDATILERRFRPGMTDNAARTLEEALRIRTGITGFQAERRDLYRIDTDDPVLREKLTGFFVHPLLHLLKDPPSSLAGALAPYPISFPIREQSDANLEKASRENLWALRIAEMRAIASHFEALGRDPTFSEMEVLAQTWSEHCKHKIFRGSIHYIEKENSGPVAQPRPSIPGHTKNLFRSTIKASTDAAPKPWLLSVFSDNAGIVGFTAEDAVCIKVETHNSPSAIDPFAGAITGIGGVHRDIIGTGYGAKPIFNLDVFCVAPARFDQERPDGILPPSRILEGVRAGVEAGGNPAGIPTIAGALVFDSSYLGKPLVFCGSGGILPRRLLEHPVMECSAKVIFPGDRIVMVGGRIGRDGIHGATFSSLALDSSEPSMANATVVQLGDPFTQKRALDFILVARDRGLYRTLTDNGAGGLSSSVGELATLSNGARLDLTNAPLKAPDLRVEEILVSESQERMTIAVPVESLEAFMTLSKKMGVESTDLGEFTDTGRFEVVYRGETRVDLDLEFLHEGCPDLSLQAEWAPTPVIPFGRTTPAPTIREALLALLASENIASKESLLRQYDHEVQGTSLVKPETQIGDHRSPNQAAAVTIGSGEHRVAAVVGVGILPEYSRFDTYTMAQASLDEAVRNVLATGAEYGTQDSVLALLDNFCWPDPVGSPKFAGDLVRAGYGLRDAAIALELPFVSGKDSMKNDYRGTQNGAPVTISVLPTILVTALGRIPDLRRARTSEFKSPDDVVYLLGPHQFSLLGSQFERIGLSHPESRALPPANWSAAKKLYSWLGSTRSKRLRSCADVSEGGTLTAVVESLFAYQLGFEWDPEWSSEAGFTEYFGEGFHTFVVSVRPEQEIEFTREWFAEGISFTRIGKINDTKVVSLRGESLPLSILESAWRSRR